MLCSSRAFLFVPQLSMVCAHEPSRTALSFGTTGGLALTDSARSGLVSRLRSPEERRLFLEDIVVDGRRVSWQDCELAFAYSLKQDDRDWCLGLFDTTLKRLLAGDFEPTKPSSPGSNGDEHFGDGLALAFAQELTDSLSISATEWDDVATSLMIARIRETAEDELYARGEEIAFTFGDASLGVSAEADCKRRDAMFKALCALRFVRLGLQ